MLTKITKIFRVKFIKNILIVAGGTAVAQIIYFMMMPFITRMYGPEAYGSLGAFMAIINILGPIVALSYPISIILPKENDKARSILQLSLVVSIISSVTVGIIIIAGSSYLSEMFNLSAYILMLIPFTILFYGLFQVSEQLTIRSQRYDVNAKTAVLQAVSDNSSKVGMGFILPSAFSLILVQSLGVLLRTILIISLLKEDILKKILNFDLQKMFIVAKEYKDFPLFRSPQIFINSLSLTFPIIFLTIFFGPAIAGFYEISRQSLNTPVNLLGKAVQDVFYPKINEIYNNRGQVTGILVKLLITLFFLGLFPFGSIMIFGPDIFSIVFGEEWESAGYYARWIALMSIFMLISRPIISVIPIFKLQAEFLIYEVFSTIFRIGSLSFGIFYLKNSEEAIALFSIASTISYSLLIFYIIINSKKNDIKNKISF